MIPIRVTNKGDEIAATADTLFVHIYYPNTLGNPLQINERWDAAFIQDQYRKYLTLKLKQKDEATIAKLDLIANHLMEGKGVVMIQGTNDVHGQLLADFIEQQIKESTG